MGTTLVIELDSAAAVQHEWTTNLQRGGAFVRDAGGDEVDDQVTLVLIAPTGQRLELAAKVVFRSPAGVGLELEDFGPGLREQLEAWVATACAAPAPGATPAPSPPARASASAGPDAPATTGARDQEFDGATISEPRAIEDFDGATIREPAPAENFDPPTTRAAPGIPMVRFSMSSSIVSAAPAAPAARRPDRRRPRRPRRPWPMWPPRHWSPHRRPAPP
ncbi:MAG: PilZ domain-containing protein [Kofleriaceae bacterium]|nr:PilZ domain-containing protein [Kofleriaceae bacterium]